MSDDPKDEGGGVGELADDAKRMIGAFGDEVDKRVNKILDERLRVNEEKKPSEGDEGKEGDEKENESKEGNDDPPAPKSLAEKLGF